jgi:hypothetical protein
MALILFDSLIKCFGFLFNVLDLSISFELDNIELVVSEGNFVFFTF